VYQDVNGLTGSARQAELIKLAMAEGGKMSLYGCGTQSAEEADAAGFQKATGIKTSILNLDCPTLISRASTEFQQKVLPADIFEATTREFAALDTAGILAPITTPVTKATMPSAVFKDYVGISQSPRVIAWNTNLIKGADIPTSYQDLLTKYPNNMTLPSEQWDWFACVTTNYFEKQQGMTEAQAVALFTKASSTTQSSSSLTLAGTLLAAGEFGVDAAEIASSITTLEKAKAPIAYQPVVGPICAQMSGVAMSSTAPHPATALLYVEYELTQAEVTNGETPTRIGDASQGIAPPTTKGFLPTEYAKDIVPIDSTIYDQAAKWQALWDTIIKASGKAPRAASK
jgi:iron(III) transport system substrate-binding protein